MSNQWYYSEDGAQYGPVDEAVIVRQIQDGELPIGTPVLQEGHMNWQPARDHACFQVEIYPKKKRPPVQATASTASKPASEGASPSAGQTTAQPAVTPTSPVVTPVIVKEKSVLPWVVAGVACIALVGVLLFMNRGSDAPPQPPAPVKPRPTPANIVPASPQSNEAWLTNLDTAKAFAKREGKMILVEFTGSDWIPPAIRLKENVFDKEAFKKYAKENLVLVELDFPRNKNKITTGQATYNRAQAKKFGIKGYPTVIIMDASGRELAKKVGYGGQSVDAYIKEIKNAKLQ
jgi:thioredoxin-related protein